MFSCCSTVPCAQVNCERHQGFTLTSSSPQCMYVKVTLMTCFCKGLWKKKNSDALKIKPFWGSLVCLHLISFFLNVLECYYKSCPYWQNLLFSIDYEVCGCHQRVEAKWLWRCISSIEGKTPLNSLMNLKLLCFFIGIIVYNFFCLFLWKMHWNSIGMLVMLYRIQLAQFKAASPIKSFQTWNLAAI